MSSEETWLLPAQAANLLNVHQETVRRYAASGLIEFKRTAGRHRRYLESDVERLIDDKSAGRVNIDSESSDTLSSETLFKFASGLQLMLEAGMPKNQALPLAFEMSGDKELIDNSSRFSEVLEEEGTISEALTTDDLFPQTIISMIKGGEDCGKLEHMLGKIADFYRDKMNLTRR